MTAEIYKGVYQSSVISNLVSVESVTLLRRVLCITIIVLSVLLAAGFIYMSFFTPPDLAGPVLPLKLKLIPV